jgi:hypothetical protein
MLRECTGAPFFKPLDAGSAKAVFTAGLGRGRFFAAPPPEALPCLLAAAFPLGLKAVVFSFSVTRDVMRGTFVASKNNPNFTVPSCLEFNCNAADATFEGLASGAAGCFLGGFPFPVFSFFRDVILVSCSMR